MKGLEYEQETGVRFLALVGEVAAHVDVEAVQAGLEADDSARDDHSVLVRVHLHLPQITPLTGSPSLVLKVCRKFHVYCLVIL
jgi:hypothetical protein